MESNQFTYLIFWHNKITTLVFFSLAMGFISLWIKKTAWLWGSFCILSLALAFQAGVISTIALLPIGLLFLCQYAMTKDIDKSFRYIVFGLITLTSLALGFHFLPGFHNLKLLSDVKLTPDALPYSLYFNFDKPWMGLFVLGLSLPLINTRAGWLKMLKITLPATVLGIALLVVIALNIGMIRWEPKLPGILFAWLGGNLVFVSIPEEAFFRGFLQREIYLWFGKTRGAAIGSVLVTSLFFALLHLFWVGNFAFLCLVFIASVTYGTLYQITEKIESSILCHYLFNVTHFLLFTYPAIG